VLTAPARSEGDSPATARRIAACRPGQEKPFSSSENRQTAKRLTHIAILAGGRLKGRYLPVIQGGSHMRKESLLINTILSSILFCSCVALAQDPVEDINKNVHPNLAAAQHHVVEANKFVFAAQKDNREDMQGHA
jgi:hypothetical protein